MLCAAFTFITFYLLVEVYGKYSRLRHQHLARDATESKAILRFGVSPAIDDNAALAADMKAMFGNDVVR